MEIKLTFISNIFSFIVLLICLCLFRACFLGIFLFIMLRTIDWSSTTTAERHLQKRRFYSKEACRTFLLPTSFFAQSAQVCSIASFVWFLSLTLYFSPEPFLLLQTDHSDKTKMFFFLNLWMRKFQDGWNENTFLFYLKLLIVCVFLLLMVWIVFCLFY